MDASVPVHFHSGREVVRLAIRADGFACVHEAFLGLGIQQRQIAGVEDKKNETWINLAPRGAEFALDCQRIDEFALKGTAIFLIQLDGGFETAFLVQACELLGADAEAHGVVFDTYIHDGWFSFNSVTVTCAL